MPRPSVSTATGDNGSTGLYGGKRVSKASDRICACGTVDELNSLLGVVLSDRTLPASVEEDLFFIQKMLLRIGSDLATPLGTVVQIDRLDPSAVAHLEERGVILEQQLPSLQTFVLPGGSPSGAHLHHARAVCRRAERCVMALSEHERVNEYVRVYLNRLSDYLFLAARFVNGKMGAGEVEWKGRP